MSEAMPGFPLLIDYTDLRFRSQTHGGYVRSEEGFDIRVEDEIGTKLRHKRILYDQFIGRFIALVEADLDDGITKKLHLYGGLETGEIVDQEDASFLAEDHHAYWRMDNGEDLTGQGRDLAIAPVLPLPPVANPDTGATVANVAVPINVLANDIGTGLSVTSVSNPPNGTAVNSGGGIVTYTPDPGFSGSDSFTYVVSNAGGSATGSVAVAITAVVSPPVASNDVLDTLRNIAVTINVVANDTLNGAAISAVSNPPHGNAVNNGNGTVTYTPDTGYTGSDSFTYTLTNSAGSSVGTVSGNVRAPTYDYPENPDEKRASYDGALYYVAPNKSGVGTPNNSSDPGGFEATCEGVNDKSRIIVTPGSYPGFNATPKSGQTGRIQILAQNPVFTDLDLSSYGGKMIGYNPDNAAKHSVISRDRLEFTKFNNLWLEGFRFGDEDSEVADNNTTTTAKVWMSERDTTSGVNWIVKNYFKNSTLQMVSIIGSRSNNHQTAVYRNYMMCNSYDPIPVSDGGKGLISDYHVYAEATGASHAWVIENILRGIASQYISFKQHWSSARALGNVIDSNYLVGTYTGGTGVYFGQVCDYKTGEGGDTEYDNTALYGEAAFNKMRRRGGVCNVHLSNFQDLDIHDNEYLSTSGQIYQYDIYTGDNNVSTGVIRGPIHPRTWTIYNETFSSPSAQDVRFGRSRVKESVQRHNVIIRDNISASNLSSTFDATSDDSNQRGYPDTLLSAYPDFDPDARMRVTFGTNAKVSHPPGNNSLTDIEIVP